MGKNEKLVEIQCILAYKGQGLKFLKFIYEISYLLPKMANLNLIFVLSYLAGCYLLRYNLKLISY